MNHLFFKQKTSTSVALLMAFFAFSLAACDSTTAPTPKPAASPTALAATATGSSVNSTNTVTPAGEQPTAATTATVSTIGAPTGTTQAADTLPSTPAANQATETPVASNEQAVAPEQNPVGDIPDNQAFVPYASPSGGYTLQVPEGWARTENGTGVSFADKLDGVRVSVTDAATAPTAKTAPGKEVAALRQSGRAVQITSVRDVQLPTGPSVLVEYTSNSEPNAVTGKQVRLENNSYLIFKNGKLATLTLWAPLGADNVDQWQQIAKSFAWK